MRVLHDLKPLSDFKEANLFFDTNTLISAYKFSDFMSGVCAPLIEVNCAFITIRSVAFEFARGSQSVEEYNIRLKWVKNLMSYFYPVEKLFDTLDEFNFVIQRTRGSSDSIKKGVSFTDFLLCYCLYKFHGSYLITENYKDFNFPFTKKVKLITLDNDVEIRNTAIYTFNFDGYSELKSRFLK